MNRSNQFVKSFRFLVAIALFAGATASAQMKLECPSIAKIEERFLDSHVLFKNMDSKIEGRTIDQFIKRLDGGKIYLRQSDVDEIKKMMKGHFAKLKTPPSDCSSIEKTHALFVTRVKERAEFAKKTLSSKTFKFDPKTELSIDPDSRKYAKTVAEQETFQKKYLNFQLSNHIATGISQDEAVQQVIRSYDRGVKRVSEINKEQIYSDYLDSYGRSLDPHTAYLSQDSLEDFEMNMSLSLEGIGASLSQQDGFTIVEQLIDGGNAKSSGLVQVQDRIVGVGQFKADGKEENLENVIEMDLRDVVKRIRGPKGTKVRLQILRPKTDGSKERLMVTLTRDKVKLEDEAAQLLMQEREVDGKKIPIAILNLPSFYSDGRRGGRSAATDLKKLINEAKEKGAKSMVLDVSTNGGGSLEDAVRIAGLFFRLGNVVKQSSQEADAPAMTLADRDPATDWNGPLTILTSRLSASASEIVSGTLSDYQRAVIVGADHTFGKGSVQSVQQLPPGLGAIKTTVGWFFTPGGFSTQWRGVDADIVLPSALSTDEIGEKTLDYSLNPQQIKAFKSEEAKSDWLEVTKSDLQNLKTRSTDRVGKNPEFAKIKEEIEKAKKRGKIIKISDSLKETKDKKAEADTKKQLSKEDRLKEYLKRADIQEAVNVAADLFAVQTKIPLNKVVIPPPPPATKVAAAKLQPGEEAPDGDTMVSAVKKQNEVRGSIQRSEAPAAKEGKKETEEKK